MAHTSSTRSSSPSIFFVRKAASLAWMSSPYIMNAATSSVSAHDNGSVPFRYSAHAANSTAQLARLNTSAYSLSTPCAAASCA